MSIPLSSDCLGLLLLSLLCPLLCRSALGRCMSAILDTTQENIQPPNAGAALAGEVGAAEEVGAADAGAEEAEVEDVEEAAAARPPSPALYGAGSWISATSRVLIQPSRIGLPVSLQYLWSND